MASLVRFGVRGLKNKVLEEEEGAAEFLVESKGAEATTIGFRSPPHAPHPYPRKRIFVRVTAWFRSGRICNKSDDAFCCRKDT